jgi:hypothetical protein
MADETKNPAADETKEPKADAPVVAPESLTNPHQRPSAPEVPDPNRFIEPNVKADAPMPGVGFWTSSTYIMFDRDIFAGSAGRVIGSYTLDSTTVTADGNGDKLVPAGTVLIASGTDNQKLAPHAATGSIVGVLAEMQNLRDGDRQAGIVFGGHLNGNRLFDNGVFGVAPGSATATALAALGIYVHSFDV